jgi:hypothetical protein
VRPTPRKLALLLSLAGLGLSLGDAAHAKGDLSAHPGILGFLGLPDEANGPPAAEGLMEAVGPLDATLPTAGLTLPPSEEDRAAVALAMVLMADAPNPWPTHMAMPAYEGFARWQPSEAFRRDYSPGDRASSAEDDAVTTAAVSEAKPAPVAAALPTTGLDLDLTLSAGVDVNLELPPVLDLDLSFSPSLDLNLALTPEVDLHLDQAPVFPVTRLRPSGAATARDNASASARLAMPSPERASPVAERSAASAARATALLEPVVPSSQPAPAARIAAEPVRPALPLPTIVVASHADRVLFSLEALLANDDPASGRFGAQTEEVIVSSHAEKALATLAAICRSDDAELPDLHVDQTSSIATAADRAAAPVATDRDDAAKPGARQEPSPRSARRSALGDGLLAINERGLDKVRGGFDAGNGLQISFGIERAVYINGSLVTTTTFNVSDLGKVAGGQPAASSAVATSGNLTLIQNGTGNTFVTGALSPATLGTVIQNTLNDQKIQNVTSINATVNSLQMVKASNFEASMRGALTDALRR